MTGFTEFLLPYLISNVLAIGVAILAWRKPSSARWVLVALFAVAAVVNAQLALEQPEAYLEYAAITPIPLYADFIDGWFRSHIRLMVLAIATGQIAIAALSAAPQPWRTFGGAGALTFLIAIAPLGIGSAFPCSLILCAAVILTLRKRGHGDMPTRPDVMTMQIQR